MARIWKWIDHNRFVVTGPIVGIMIWAYAVGCQPQTASPLDHQRQVNAAQLEIDFKTWQAEQEITAAKFEAAGQDIEQQTADNKKIEKFILGVASGGIADMPALLKLLVAGGGLGAITDNIRKRGLISGLKRNKK